MCLEFPFWEIFTYLLFLLLLWIFFFLWHMWNATVLSIMDFHVACKIMPWLGEIFVFILLSDFLRVFKDQEKLGLKPKHHWVGQTLRNSELCAKKVSPGNDKCPHMATLYPRLPDGRNLLISVRKVYLLDQTVCQPNSISCCQAMCQRSVADSSWE